MEVKKAGGPEGAAGVRAAVCGRNVVVQHTR
jgi:hypothetical protein